MKRYIILVFLLLFEDVILAQFFVSNFYINSITWQKGETPLNAYKTTFEQNYAFNFDENLLKEHSITKVVIANIRRDTLDTIKPLVKEVLFEPSFYEVSQIYFFDEKGRIIYNENFDLFDGILKIINKKEYLGEDTVKASNKVYLLSFMFGDMMRYVISDTTYIYRETSQKQMHSFNEKNIYLGNYLTIDTSSCYGFSEYNPGNYLFINSRANWLDTYFCYGTEFKVYFNKDSLVEHFDITYINEYQRKTIVKSRIKYRNNKSIEKIYEQEYELKDNNDTVLLRMDTLFIKGDFETSKDYRLYLNGELIFKRQITANFILEQNFETGEYRYIKLETGLPIYEIKLRKIWDQYLYSQRILIYTNKNSIMKW